MPGLGDRRHLDREWNAPVKQRRTGVCHNTHMISRFVASLLPMGVSLSSACSTFDTPAHNIPTGLTQSKACIVEFIAQTAAVVAAVVPTQSDSDLNVPRLPASPISTRQGARIDHRGRQWV